ncbi:hypothetical protein CEXT_721181 [Caerostris extrusa]|uniref:Uncharacterized protein n=1 Tax=Caerostris extrusa TaxID=172846 RepID=A0AAV4VAP7_CAEEX|nr:hypothetical protein CEXT_721181 [Caerostris extrusa]
MPRRKGFGVEETERSPRGRDSLSLCLFKSMTFSSVCNFRVGKCSTFQPTGGLLHLSHTSKFVNTPINYSSHEIRGAKSCHDFEDCTCTPVAFILRKFKTPTRTSSFDSEKT